MIIAVDNLLQRLFFPHLKQQFRTSYTAGLVRSGHAELSKFVGVQASDARVETLRWAGDGLAGKELVDDASAVVNDTMKSIVDRSPRSRERISEMIEMLEDFGR